MSHDDGSGIMALEDDKLQISWHNVGEQENFVKGNEKLYQATKALGGEYVKNPIWTKIFHQSLVTVHPLGGCVIGTNAEQGVTNHKGQVFSGASGSNVYQNLYISDGAIIPTSLAVNPLLTISAMAERCCMLIAKDRGWSIDYSLPSRSYKPITTSKLGIEFTEKMQGHFSTEFESSQSLASYQHAQALGAAANSPIEFTLTIRSDDLEEILGSAEHNAAIIGTVNIPALSDKPLAVSDGVFNLFVVYPQTPDTRHMNYKMKLTSETGDTFLFSGYKLVKDSCVETAWRDTSTLYVTIYRGDDDKSPVLGKGMMHIKPADFAVQMTTMQALNATSSAQKLAAIARFGKYFAGVMWQTYGGVFYQQPRFNPDSAPRKKRPLRAGEPNVHFFNTEDGVTLRLTRHQGGIKGPVMLVHGLGVSSSIFSTDTIQTNLLEYLYAHQYDVWLLDFRVSIDLAASSLQSNGDQVAKYDFPAAINVIRAQTSCDSVQAVVHCYGATTFFMSMLSGLQHVRSIVCSQIATNLVLPTATAIKTGVHLPGVLEKLGVESMTAYTDSNESLLDKLFDKAVGINALVSAQGQCSNPVCHRITFLYASLFRHDNINKLLHDNLHELFGEANVETLAHLAQICRHKVLVSANGENIYMENLANLKLPICFISGAMNECYLPESTLETFNLLRKEFGAKNYSRKVIDQYGHIDCIFGAKAVDDVYPTILKHLDATANTSTTVTLSITEESTSE